MRPKHSILADSLKVVASNFFEHRKKHLNDGNGKNLKYLNI